MPTVPQITPKTEMNPPKASKINLTAVISAIAAVVAIWGVDIPAEQQATIVAGIVAAQSALTIIWRTFFTEPADAQTTRAIKQDAVKGGAPNFQALDDK